MYRYNSIDIAIDLVSIDNVDPIRLHHTSPCDNVFNGPSPPRVFNGGLASDILGGEVIYDFSRKGLAHMVKWMDLLRSVIGSVIERSSQAALKSAENTPLTSHVLHTIGVPPERSESVKW